MASAPKVGAQQHTKSADDKGDADNGHQRRLQRVDAGKNTKQHAKQKINHGKAAFSFSHPIPSFSPYGSAYGKNPG